MRLRPGCADSYRARHADIWPDLADLLRQSGVRDYSIDLEAETGLLFASLWRTLDHSMGQLSDHPLMRHWWTRMADLMETHPDASPVVTPLVSMFHLR